MRRCGKQADAFFTGVLAKLLQGAGPNTPPRRVDDAQECTVIIMVGNQAQVGHDVLDL